MRIGFLLLLILSTVGCHSKPATSDPTTAEVRSSQETSNHGSTPAGNYIGTYTATRFLKGKPIDNASLPPGQRMLLELKSGSTWEMRDMLSGFEGNWTTKDGEILLTPITGPAGKVKDNAPLVLKPMPDRSRLVLIAPKEMKGTVEFHFDPDAVKEIGEAMQERMQSISK